MIAISIFGLNKQTNSNKLITPLMREIYMITDIFNNLLSGTAT